jgi:demethylmenaquinone methyltransferase/2-methoxy-6-polyprenyl-1,4-benzoquinol methylase
MERPATGERPDAILAEQIAYYRARAGEYDEWFLRQGRYDQGPELNRQWFAEVAEVAAALERLAPYGRVLELACGTGWWTEQLARHAASITALDASPEVIAINRQRVQSERVSYEVADLFAWTPSQQYDVVFFSFWLSHVPAERFAPFWEGVQAALAPGGRVVFIDSRYEQSTTARDQPLEGLDAVTLQRRLNNGREYRIVKVFYTPDALSARLHELGWDAEIATTASYFVYGTATARGDRLGAERAARRESSHDRGSRSVD